MTDEMFNRLMMVLRVKKLISGTDGEFIRGLISENEWIEMEDEKDE